MAEKPVGIVFLDRDGVINEDRGYVSSPQEVVILEGVVEGIRVLNQNGLKVVVVTNQSGVARGYFSESIVQYINEYIRRKLAQNNATIDAFYYCPHHPKIGPGDYKKNCNCRKPKPGMILEAMDDFDVSEPCFLVGDSLRDIQAGIRAGCKTYLVSHDSENQDIDPEIDIVPDLFETATRIVNMIKDEK